MKTVAIYSCAVVLILVGAAYSAPTTVTFQISHGNNNAWGFWYNPTNENPDYLVVGNWTPEVVAGMRFYHCTIPKGSYITDARLKIQAYNVRTDQLYGEIQAEDQDNPGSFIYKRNFDRPTTATVRWDHSATWQTNTWYTSPNIASVIQEVIDRPGWQSGFSICILYAGRVESGGRRYILAYKTNPSLAPKLEVTYDYRTISGRITDDAGNPIEGVTVSADNGGRTTTTNSQGNYQVKVPPGWSGTVTPSAAGWVITPQSRSYSDVTTNLSDQGYSAFQPRISGHVLDTDAHGVQGVLMSGDNAGGSDTTDPNGYYRLSVPYEWSGTVTPDKALWFFEPQSLLYSSVTGDITDQNFTAFELPKISGRVLNDPNGVAQVMITADNGGGSVETDLQGDYELILPYGWTGTVTPAMPGRFFEPPGYSYTNLTSSLIQQDFILLPISVKADGGGDFPTIQAAIDASINPDKIILEPGIYSGEGNFGVDFGGKAVTLRSVDPNNPGIIAATVMQGPWTGDWSPGPAGFYFQSSEGLDSVVDGLTITKGASLNGAGGVTCFQSSPTIRNCVVRECFGGGISLWDSNAVVSNCVIIGNYGVEGAGLSCYAGNPVISNCIISNNDRGGVVLWECSTVISNCTITGNAFYIPPEYPEDYVFGVVSVNYDSSVVIHNSILWNTLGDDVWEIAVQDYSQGDHPCTVTVSYCDIDGDRSAAHVDPGSTLNWGLGNIDEDPLFARDPNDGGDGWVDLPNTENIDEGANNDHGDLHLKSRTGRWQPSIYINLDPTGDGFINMADFGAFAGYCGKQGGSLPADLDNNRIVDLSDLALLLDSYLSGYPRGQWITDTHSSPCIDTGDHASSWAGEPWPHGSRINMGAYGGTAEASKSLATLIRATYDPSEHIRKRAAQSLSNYMFPSTESDLAPFQRDLLFLRKHLDSNVKDLIEKGLERMGWIDLDLSQGEGPSIREDIEAHLLPKPYAERRGYMIGTFEELRQRAIDKEDEELLREIYTKLLILDPGNEEYTGGLKECVSRQNSARLSAAEVLRMADRFAAEKRAKHETFDLKFYPDRSAKFKTERKSWYVHYTRVPNRWPGDHFSVYVDDTTGEMKFFGGA